MGLCYIENKNEILKNVEQFNKDLKKYEWLGNNLSHFKHWYYIPKIDLFGPSKFIGYKNMNFKKYYKYNWHEDNSKCLDGRETEKVLKRWRNSIEDYGYDIDELKNKLSELHDIYNKKVRKNAQIHIISI